MHKKKSDNLNWIDFDLQNTQTHTDTIKDDNSHNLITLSLISRKNQ